MKTLKILVAILMAMVVWPVSAQTVDSVDVIDYDLTLDLSDGAPFSGVTVLTMRLERPCTVIGLDLEGTVDSIFVSGRDSASHDIAAIALPAVAVGDTFTVTVYYHGHGYVESYGWGGFHFNNDMSYNLGVAFEENPHVLGRAMFPCRDNFTDKATYTLRMKTRSGWTAECGGMCQGREVDTAGCEHSVWRIAQPTPTYLVSVSQAAWRRMQRDVVSADGTYPLTVGFTTQDSSNVVRAFAELDSVVPMYERCFGPYRWNRIGYIATWQGSMESVNNIALVRSFVTSMDERAQSTIAHELGHSWFGNLVTCSSERDMWFNEGGASFTSEVAMESVLGRISSNDYYQRNLESVIRTSHITDNGYRPLSGMPHAYTYGSTTYDKGWMMWHFLRGYLGEQRFYNAMTRLMQDKAFGTVDAYEVRDSLSHYTGVDLTDFFDFHVFGRGFVDYHVEMERGGCLEDEVAVRIRQQGVGTDATMNSNRVPVTFFADGEGWDSTSCKRWIEFDGTEAQEMVHLPFVPAFCVLDLDREISDAATNAEIAIKLCGQRGAEVAHMRIKVNERQEDSLTLYIEHHWGKPYDVDTIAGVRSTIHRYWVVNSSDPRIHGVQGMFRFVRANATSGNYPHLDKDRLPYASFDSAALLYRPGAGRPWTAVSRTTLNGGYEDFFVVDNLRPGEYTIAIVDTALVGVPAIGGGATAQLFPNPLHRGEALTVELPGEEPFSVTVYDSAGHIVWQRHNVTSGKKLRPRLAAGTYMVRIDNKHVTMQSKLIQL